MSSRRTNDFRNEIARRLADLKLTQREAAERAGWTQAQLSGYLAGSRQAWLASVQRLVQALGGAISVKWGKRR